MSATVTSAKTTVLLHGTTGFSEDWSAVIADLEKRNRTVLRIDYLKSPNGGNAAATLAEAASNVLIEASHAGIEGPFDLVGYSLGAAVATLIAAAHPARVRSLTLISGFSHSDARMKLQFDLWLDLANRDRKALVKVMGLSGYSGEFLAQFDEKTLAAVADRFIAVTDWEKMQQAIRLDLNLDVREQARKILASTLTIVSKHDQMVPGLYSHQLADLISDVQRAEIDSGHLSFAEQPAELALLISKFSDSVKQPNLFLVR